jgi:hypothetical protein
MTGTCRKASGVKTGQKAKLNPPQIKQARHRLAKGEKMD